VTLLNATTIEPARATRAARWSNPATDMKHAMATSVIPSVNQRNCKRCNGTTRRDLGSATVAAYAMLIAALTA